MVPVKVRRGHHLGGGGCSMHARRLWRSLCDCRHSC
jgi:hypothetical protein